MAVSLFLLCSQAEYTQYIEKTCRSGVSWKILVPSETQATFKVVMMDAAPRETLSIQVEFGLHSGYPYSWGWELNGDDNLWHWGVEDTQLAAYLAALGTLEDVSAMLGNPSQEAADPQENSSIFLRIGVGILASYPDKWAWEVSSEYNGYGWGTGSSLQEVTREAHECFQKLQSEITLVEVARLRSSG